MASVSMNKGVKQGCPASKLLFSLFFDRVAAYLENKNFDIARMSYFKFALVYFCILMFVDGAVLIVRTPD